VLEHYAYLQSTAFSPHDPLTLDRVRQTCYKVPRVGFLTLRQYPTNNLRALLTLCVMDRQLPTI
jgi:hypothetical protein